MYHHENPKKIILSRQFRKKPTKSESIMWECLRNRRFMRLKFRRQFPFVGYILDFYCYENKVCIEVNGGIHYSSKEIMERDKFRENVLISYGLFVINVNAWDVEDRITETLKYIKNKIKEII